MPFALPDLRSRLLAAEIFQLRELDDDGLLVALQLRAHQRGLELSDEAAEFLLRRLPRDMHTLCDDARPARLRLARGTAQAHAAVPA